MEYVKQTFVPGQILTAECLNNIEDGLYEACLTCPDLSTEGRAADAKATGEKIAFALQEIERAQEAAQDKVSKTGWSADKYLGTDAEGNVVEKDAPGGGGGLTEVAWEDVQNNPFVGTEVEIFPEQNIAITLQDEENRMYGWMAEPAVFNLEPGKTYRVIWNGDEYSCVCQGQDGAYALGNLWFMTGDETLKTEEPFLFYMATFEENGEMVSINLCVTADTAETTHQVQIYKADKAPLLPSVSAADEGKLLQVVEGAWTPVWPDTESGDAVPVHIDLSNYKTQGTIVESFSEGTVATTTVTFDTEGRPSSITSPDGHYTTINW